MKWLTKDYSDFYIEEIKHFNICGKHLNSIFYIRHAYYNLFGNKSYKRLVRNGIESSFDLSFPSLEYANKFLQEFRSKSETIVHKSNPCL